MFGRKELGNLRLRKEVLLLESRLNRLTFRAETQNLRSACDGWLRLGRTSRRVSPLLLVLAPIAGYLLVRGSRSSVASRVASAAKWLAPLYRLWRMLSRLAREQPAQSISPKT